LRGGDGLTVPLRARKRSTATLVHAKARRRKDVGARPMPGLSGEAGIPIEVRDQPLRGKKRRNRFAPSRLCVNQSRARARTGLRGPAPGSQPASLAGRVGMCFSPCP
jgi:hypothetical protein